MGCVGYKTMMCRRDTLQCYGIQSVGMQVMCACGVYVYVWYCEEETRWRARVASYISLLRVGLRTPKVLVPEGTVKCQTFLRERGGAHQSSGSVAPRILTSSTPSSRSARGVNAPCVRSTCLEPTAQPAQESTTRTKTHFLGVLQTRVVCKEKIMI